MWKNAGAPPTPPAPSITSIIGKNVELSWSNPPTGVIIVRVLRDGQPVLISDVTATSYVEDPADVDFNTMYDYAIEYENDDMGVNVTQGDVTTLASMLCIVCVVY